MKVVLIGHSVAVKKAILAIQGSEHEVLALFTHPKADHQRDLELYDWRKDHFGNYGYDVFDLEEDLGIPVFEYQDIHSKEDLESIQKYSPDVIVTIGCRHILKSHFIDSFPFVINLHPYHLPYYRGAGLDTWMILDPSEGRHFDATAHFITPRIDAGRIICTESYTIPENARPIDIFKVRMDTLGLLFKKALDTLASGAKDFEDQDDSVSRYYPRLNTNKHGEIQFQEWGVEEIARFIRAFSYPYEGAWTEIKDQKIHIHEARFEKTEAKHSFLKGIVYRKDAEGFFIHVKDGWMYLSGLEKDRQKAQGTEIKLGTRLN